MPARLDHDRIRLMAETGVPDALIARRLRCSEKQVGRILADTPRQVNPLVGTASEHLLWRLYHTKGETPGRIARRFGYSRQFMYDHFKTQPKNRAQLCNP